MKKSLSVLCTLVLTLVVFGYASQASAVTVYTSETEFTVALDSYYLENFDEFDGLFKEGTSSLAKAGNGYGYTISVSKQYDHLYYQLGGVSTNSPNSSITFDFTDYNITAFGGLFWPSDEDGDGQTSDLSIEVVLADGSSQTYLFEDASASTFTGFTSTQAIASIIISGDGSSSWTDGDLWVSVDHLYAGSASAVPVPGALSLLGGGLLCIAGLRRKA